jgi:ankyrin repeat protein
MTTAKEKIRLNEMLISACKHGYIDTVRELLCSGADVNVTSSNGITPLHFACMDGHTEVVKELYSFKIFMIAS